VRDTHNLFESLGLRSHNALTKVGQPVVAASFVVQFRIRALIRRLDQSIGQHTLD
jgi:hypothetical protein